eukprot:Em0018g1111a
MLSIFFPTSFPGSDSAVRRSPAMEDGIGVKTLTPTMTNSATINPPVVPATAEGTRLVKQAGTPIARATPPALSAPRVLEEAGAGKCSVAAQTVSQGMVAGRPISPPKFKAPVVAATVLLQNNIGGEGTPSPDVSVTAATSSHVQAASATASGGESTRPFSSEHSSSSHDDRDLSLFNKQVAKLKRFFTTLQDFANKISQEVAEQVQELITALVNGTVTVVEFHQEIQSVTNHPLKEFIIPFLKESLDPLRQHLKASSQDIADILDMVQTPGPSLGLTPQLIDTELPVLPSAKPPSFISTPNASSLSPMSANSVARTTSSPPPRPSNLAIFSSTNTDDCDLSPNASPQAVTSSGSSGARKRVWNAMGQEKARGHNPDLDRERGHNGDPEKASTKRLKPVTPAEPERLIPATDVATPPLIPSLQQSQPLLVATSSVATNTPGVTSSSIAPNLTAATPSILPTVNPTLMDGARASQVNNLSTSLPATMAVWLNEDWGHIDVMLGAIQQMLERTHNAVNTLRDRLSVVELALHQSRSEQERKEELEKEADQRVVEAVEKFRLGAAEERQKLLAEANKHMVETVNAVRTEMEGRMAQAVEEALKQANVQNNAKEMCWNCGRRATETCSGCNKARYCGTFCQHKDWVKHMHDCLSGIQGMEVDHEQETTDRPIMGHSNDIIQPDRRGEAPRSRGGLLLDTATQGCDEDKKTFTTLTHPTSLI